jgi:uncharacterized membrane protein YebE (DUF533 family)
MSSRFLRDCIDSSSIAIRVLYQRFNVIIILHFKKKDISMSMLGTLGKIAMGVMVAKTVGKAMGGSGGLLGGLLGSNKAQAPQSGTPNSSGGGFGDILNSLAGGEKSQTQGGGLGDLLSNALQGKEVEATPSDEQKAEVLLNAMLNAAKADGKIDAEEEAKLTKHIGDASPEEIEIVKKAINSPLDVEAFIKSVPKGMEQQVYMMSLLAIDLDNQKEAEYLDSLSRGLNIPQQTANLIHQKVGAPVLYS